MALCYWNLFLSLGNMSMKKGISIAKMTVKAVIKNSKGPLVRAYFVFYYSLCTCGTIVVVTTLGVVVFLIYVHCFEWRRNLCYKWKQRLLEEKKERRKRRLDKMISEYLESQYWMRFSGYDSRYSDIIF
uniref:Uncharacterized protein n=1 Tax=Lepidodinium chlorophorum TaxID=107758 RepID=A0A0F7R564_LEPCH|nr:hypothetical protein [Lepidodinium chlorophorum]BAR72339.1 hypothetical protein [Lepidodinium chlorophorum]